MTTKGILGLKLPYSFIYSSCSEQAGIGLMLGGIPNIPFHPWLLEQSVKLWNSGITPMIIQNSYQLE